MDFQIQPLWLDGVPQSQSAAPQVWFPGEPCRASLHVVEGPVAGFHCRPWGWSTTSFAKCTLIEFEFQNVWVLQSFPYRVLQEELCSQEHLPNFSAFFDDWEPQQLGTDSHTGVQLHYGGACTAAHGLILTLAWQHTRTPLIPSCICLCWILKCNRMCFQNSQLGRCRTVPAQHREDCGQWFAGLHRSQCPQRGESGPMWGSGWSQWPLWSCWREGMRRGRTDLKQRRVW